MQWLNGLGRSLCSILARRQKERELSEEVQFHLERQIEQNLATGMSPEEARYAALRTFGGVEQVKEACREQRGLRMIETLWQDLRYGVRQLRRNPGFTAVAALTLSIGIGLNTSMFSLIDVALFSSLPYAHATRLVWVETLGSHFKDFTKSSGPDFVDWSRRNHVFSSMTAYETHDTILSGAEEPLLIRAAFVSQDFFQTFGVKPSPGRAFEEGDTQVVIISYGLWKQQFGGESDMAGKVLSIGGNEYLIVGVMPRGFNYPADAQAWMPLGIEKEPGSRNTRHLDVVGRLKANVALGRARADMAAIAGELALKYPDSNHGKTIALSLLKNHLVGGAEPALILLWGAASIVLLIACVNVANLLLSRTITRRQETAIRLAFGARVRRILSQFMAESLLLSFIGAGLGLIIAFWSVHIFSSLLPKDIAIIEGVSINGHVLAFALMLAVLTGILFGVAPGLSIFRVAPNELLKGGRRSLGHSADPNYFRKIFLVSETALAQVLLITSTLLIVSLWRLESINPGFDADHIVTLSLNLPERRYPLEQEREVFFGDLLDRVNVLPGVFSVAIVYPLPFGGDWLKTRFWVGKAPPDTDSNVPIASLAAVTPDYFRTMRIPMLRGRYFTDHDNTHGSRVAIADELLAHTFWPHQDPIGQIIHQGSVKLTVVGVVGHVKNTSLADDPGPELYVPYLQDPPNFGSLVVHTFSRPSLLMPLIRQQLRTLDKEIPISGLSTMETRLSASVSGRRTRSLLLCLFAVSALVLAAVGIYGVTSYSVSQRTHEIGIRMALGAQGGDVLKMVIEQGIRVALVGIIAGIGGALALTRFLSSLLYGVKASDPLIFVAIPAFLMAVALFACYIPARRAAKVDPMVALRYE